MKKDCISETKDICVNMCMYIGTDMNMNVYMHISIEIILDLYLKTKISFNS